MTKIRTLKNQTRILVSSINKIVAGFLQLKKTYLATKSKIDSIGHKFVVVPTFSTFLTTWRAFLAANPPIDTWSSVPALVDKESTDAGWHKVLFSETVQDKKKDSRMSEKCTIIVYVLCMFGWTRFIEILAWQGNSAENRARNFIIYS